MDSSELGLKQIGKISVMTSQEAHYIYYQILLFGLCYEYHKRDSIS